MTLLSNLTKFTFSLDIDQCGCNYNAISGYNIGTGSIVSPSYPADYPPSKLCDWLITAPSGYHVTLSFSHLHLEGNCDYDSLEVK